MIVYIKRKLTNNTIMKIISISTRISPDIGGSAKQTFLLSKYCSEQNSMMINISCIPKSKQYLKEEEMELNKNIIAPVRIKIKKREIDKVRVGCTICLILFVVGISIYCGYWYFTDWEDIKEQKSFETFNHQPINETIYPLKVLNNITFESIQNEF